LPRKLPHGQIFLFAILILLMRFEPVSAQGPSKIEIVPILGHTAKVYSVAFSPDGTHVLSGSDDKMIKLWDAATGMLIRRLHEIAHSGAGVRGGGWAAARSDGPSSADGGVQRQIRI
jgi:WD40 repeat protein